MALRHRHKRRTGWSDKPSKHTLRFRESRDRIDAQMAPRREALQRASDARAFRLRNHGTPSPFVTGGDLRLAAIAQNEKLAAALAGLFASTWKTISRVLPKRVRPQARGG